MPWLNIAIANAMAHHATHSITLEREFLKVPYEVRVSFTINPGYKGAKEGGLQIEPDFETEVEVCSVCMKIKNDWIQVDSNEDFNDEILERLDDEQ